MVLGAVGDVPVCYYCNPGISERIVTSYVTIWRLVMVPEATAVVDAVVAETAVGVPP